MAYTLVCALVCAPLVTLTAEWQAGSCCSLGFGIIPCSVVRGHPWPWWLRHAQSLSRLTGSDREAQNPRGSSIYPPSRFFYRLYPHLSPTPAQEPIARRQILLSEKFKYLQLVGSELVFQGVCSMCGGRRKVAGETFSGIGDSGKTRHIAPS